jgi:hypothetical protein
MHCNEAERRISQNIVILPKGDMKGKFIIGTRISGVVDTLETGGRGRYLEFSGMFQGVSSSAYWEYKREIKHKFTFSLRP